MAAATWRPWTRVSIHASHAGGDSMKAADNLFDLVSIHASHAGGDSTSQNIPTVLSSFNPRLPCGRRLQSDGANWRIVAFQSTPPMREATAKYGAINSNPPIGGDNHKKQ